MPTFHPTIKDKVYQAKATIEAIERKQETGHYHNARWSDRKCYRIAHSLGIVTNTWTSLGTVKHALKAWVAREEMKAYAAEDDNRAPWE